MDSIRTILVATDFSHISDYALDYAIDLASVVGAKHITVLHAVEVPIYAYPDGRMVSTEDVSERILSAARASLSHACESRVNRNKNVRLTPALREGAIWDHVSAVAREINADLVVIGTHGRKGVAHMLLGSAAEKILRSTTRPVLVVRPPHEPM